MAKKPETVFWERIKPKLKSIPRSWFFKVQLVARWGVPDVIGLINGRFVALELKKDSKGHGGAGEPLQKHTLSLILKAGGFAKVVYPENWQETYQELQDLLKDAKHS